MRQKTDEIVFAWWPVPVWRLMGRIWIDTHGHAWLRKVRIVRTMWGETYYTEIED